MNGAQVKKVVLLGSTGSIGRQAIDVILAHPKAFDVVALAANSDLKTMEKQIALVKPRFACLVDETAADKLSDSAKDLGCEVSSGEQAVAGLAALEDIDIVVNAIVGSAGLAATLKCLSSGKLLALANKESMVAAGDLVNRYKNDGRGRIIPIDSEHSALFQCLNGEKTNEVKRLILTASGGPFWGKDRRELAGVTADDALKHPRWEMGSRITIDSATLMNKGFEVIEANALFGIGYERIDVIVHPQSIVHSMVEFVDGSIKAQLGPTDMRLPIQHALFWPDRVGPAPVPWRISDESPLQFCELDKGWAPCFELALWAGKRGGSYPAVLNAADEVAVEGFLCGTIRFLDIGDIIKTTLQAHKCFDIDSIEAFKKADGWARRETAKNIDRINNNV